MRTVRIGDLSADLIQQAGTAGRILAITHDRELAGIVIPVTPGLVEFLIEQNMSRVRYSISLAEKQLKTTDQMTLLDQLAGQPVPAPPDSVVRQHRASTTSVSSVYRLRARCSTPSSP